MKYIFLFVLALCVPFVVHADVHITEVAWMGTADSQYSEWLELYNDGAEEINLAGWKLYEGSGSVVFTLTKSIEASGYLLIERTTASAPDPVPGINDEAGPFGGGGLANTGEDLVLKDASGSVAETLSFASGWPAGDSTTKATMQWNGSKWITATATPDAPATDGDEGGDGSSSPTSDTPTDQTLVDPYPIPATSPNKPHVEFTIPKSVYVGMSYEYKARPIFEYNQAIDHGIFNWNMGDGTLYYQTDFVPLVHTYAYPGTYTVSFVYKDPINANNTLQGTQKVTVVAPSLTLSIKDKSAIELKNTSTVAVDLSNWKLASAGITRDIPDMTIVAERATIDIPFSILSLPFSSTVKLIDPSGAVVATSASIEHTPVSEVADTVSIDTAPYESPNLSNTLVAHAADSMSTTPITNNTKEIIFGIVALFVITLSILLERFMARQEYQQKE